MSESVPGNDRTRWRRQLRRTRSAVVLVVLTGFIGVLVAAAIGLLVFAVVVTVQGRLH